ncbi:hypothetical protein HYQ46_009794 [Verticillium longisporum]|nr:hypothetical protein HYQ46_009794 [Verticillium longisporum]
MCSSYGEAQKIEHLCQKVHQWMHFGIDWFSWTEPKLSVWPQPRSGLPWKLVRSSGQREESLLLCLPWVERSREPSLEDVLKRPAWSSPSIWSGKGDGTGLRVERVLVQRKRRDLGRVVIRLAPTHQ